MGNGELLERRSPDGDTQNLAISHVPTTPAGAGYGTMGNCQEPVVPKGVGSIMDPNFIGRWRHRDKMVFRCWPKWKLAYEAVQKETTFTINGMRINPDGHAELWHQISGTRSYVFEISDEDFDTITAIPKAGAKMGKMIVRAPGTADERVKKECYLEVEVEIYPDAFRKRITPWGPFWNQRSPHEIFGESIADALGLAGVAGARSVFIESDDDIDEDVILHEVINNNSFIVLNHRYEKERKCGVTTRAGRRLVEKAMYWVVPGREPWEDGGALRGYQFPDRILRFMRRVDPENRAAEREILLEKMHSSTREKGNASRRTYFLENVVTRFAERVGMSRQRVMARFLDDGVVGWLMRSVDNVKAIQGREAEALLRGRVSDAVRALEFYYRAVEGMNTGGGNYE